MKPIQLIVTRDPQGGVGLALNRETPAEPLEVLGLLAIAQATILDSMRAPKVPGVQVVTGPAAAAIARDAVRR